MAASSAQDGQKTPHPEIGEGSSFRTYALHNQMIKLGYGNTSPKSIKPRSDPKARLGGNEWGLNFAGPCRAPLMVLPKTDMTPSYAMFDIDFVYVVAKKPEKADNFTVSLAINIPTYSKLRKWRLKAIASQKKQFWGSRDQGREPVMEGWQISNAGFEHVTMITPRK